MARNPPCTLLGLIPALALAACGESEPAPDAAASPPTAETATPASLPSPTPNPTLAPAWIAYDAGGNEPFWTVRTEAPGRITYLTPELLDDGVTLPATIARAGEWIRFEARYAGAPLVLEVRKRQCFDSMSGFEFSHEARLTRADGTWDGCARLASEPQPHE